MTILKHVGTELWSMFVADAWLTLALLALVGVTGGAIRLVELRLPYSGAVLALGTVIVLLLGIVRSAGSAQSRHPERQPQ